jgi:fumarate reductase subunit C
MVVLNLVALAFVVLHAITWFTLAPKAMVVRLQGRPLPARMVAGGHFAAWAVASAVVAWIVLGGW